MRVEWTQSPLSRGLEPSPEQQVCGGVDDVVVNIDRAPKSIRGVQTISS